MKTILGELTYDPHPRCKRCASATLSQESGEIYIGCILSKGPNRCAGPFSPQELFELLDKTADLTTKGNDDMTSTQNTQIQWNRVSIGTLDDAQTSVIRLASENAKLRDALKLIMNNPKHGGYWCAGQATLALRLYADGCDNINPTSTTQNQ